MMGGAQTNFLTRLTFADGSTEWVAAAEDPNECVGTTNGRFESQVNMGTRFAAALKAGRWTAPPPPDQTSACVGGARYGQQQVMVPVGAVKVDICRFDGSNKETHAAASSGFAPLIEALDAEPTVPSTSSCHDTTYDAPTTGQTQPSTMYTVVFQYASGPPVAVRVTATCVPAIDNSSLQAVKATKVVPLLAALFRSNR